LRKSSELQREINHAALAYLNLWFRTDRHHMRTLSDPLTGEALRKVAAKYMVARGISMKDAQGNAIPEKERDRRWNQAATLVSRARRLAKGDAAVVRKLATQLGELDTREYDLASAATKFLWFAGRYEVRILDVRAVRALRQLERPPRGTTTDYEWFEKAWARQIAECAQELEKAVENLPKQFPWSAVPGPWQQRALEEAIAHAWFQDRVFDQYLWAKGARARPASEQEPVGASGAAQ
jgi:hypothetical protein